MGKVFSKKNKVKEKKPAPVQEKIEDEVKPEISENNNKNEKMEKYKSHREFDDTPIPDPYNAPMNSPFLSIPKVKDDPGSIDGIPIWNASDMFWQEKFAGLGFLDDDFEKDIEEIEKIKIKDMTKKQCCEFITYYMRTGTFTTGIANGDIPRLAKRINDLYELEKGKKLPEEEEEIKYPSGYEVDENSDYLTVFDKIPCFIIDGKAEVKDKHIKWIERFKKMGLYNDNCDDISELEKKRIEKMNKEEVLKFMSYYVKKEMIPQAVGNGDLGRLANRYNDIIDEEEEDR